VIATGLAFVALVAGADPKPVVEGDVTEAHVNGMTILVKKVPNAELAAVQLYVRGGARNWGKADAGVEELAFRVAANGGTKALDKVAFANKAASLGINIGADTGRDYSAIMGKAPLASFDTMLGLVEDCLLTPALPASELEIQRQQQLSEIRHGDEDPDGRLRKLQGENIWKGHPYENRPEGTVDVVSKLTPAQIEAQLAKVRESKRLVLVVVGDVDANKVIEQAKTVFAKLPRGGFDAKPLPAPSFKKATLVTEKRDLPTNYIQALTLGPKPGTKDYAAANALNTMLWERMFEEVRTKRNLSYAVGVPFAPMEAATLVGIYVTAVDPNAAVPVMIDELKKVQNTPLTDVELAAAKAMTRTNMLMGEQTTDGQARALASGWMLTGDWRFEKKLLDTINTITAKDMQLRQEDLRQAAVRAAR